MTARFPCCKRPERTLELSGDRESLFSDRATIHVPAVGRRRRAQLPPREVRPEGRAGRRRRRRRRLGRPDRRSVAPRSLRASQTAPDRGRQGGNGGGTGRTARPAPTSSCACQSAPRFDEGGDLLADLARPGASVVVARAVRPAAATARFVTSTRQMPRFAEVGPAW